MFTGIVENVGKVVSLSEGKEAWTLRLSLPFENGEGLEAGASLSVNGCCLTLRDVKNSATVHPNPNLIDSLTLEEEEEKKPHSHLAICCFVAI